MSHARLTRTEEIISQYTQDCRIPCPECSADRRKKNEKTMSITVHPDRILYDCHHCTAQGVIHMKPIKDYVAILEEQKRKKVTKLPTKLNEDNDLIAQFFAHRGVKLDDPSKLPLTTGVKYFPGIGVETEAIGFVYGNPKEPDAIKWRPLDGTKTFTQDGAAREFYGIDMLPADAKDFIIVEGEADVIALASIGIPAVSCPNGAPMKVSPNGIDPSEDKKFSYVWEAKDRIGEAEKIILAVDNDEPGEALTEELARRIGRARCWRTDFGDYNDPNEMLEKAGEQALRDAIDTSEPVPLAGIYSAQSYAHQIMEFYSQGHGKGETTGLPNIDQLFTIKPGVVYIVTGLPSSGKSEFIDQLMVNLALKRQWKWAVASFENPPAIHIAKMAEKIVGKPFYEGVTPRMSQDELRGATDYVNDHFVFLQNRDGELPTIDSIITRTKDAIMRLGCRGLVIDPYNYIQMKGDNENREISEMLTKIVAFAQAHEIAVFFIAHPMKMYPREDGTLPVPVGMHISGSAAWFAKADVGITVHRSTAGVEIHCWKSRFKWIGQQGVQFLDYEIPTGRYFVPRDLAEREQAGPGLSKNWRRKKRDAVDDKPEDFDDIDLDNLDF